MKINLSISEENRNHCKEASLELFGRKNVSGYIGMLIKQDINSKKKNK